MSRAQRLLRHLNRKLSRFTTPTMAADITAAGTRASRSPARRPACSPWVPWGQPVGTAGITGHPITGIMRIMADLIMAITMAVLITAITDITDIAIGITAITAAAFIPDAVLAMAICITARITVKLGSGFALLNDLIARPDQNVHVNSFDPVLTANRTFQAPPAPLLSHAAPQALARSR